MDDGSIDESPEILRGYGDAIDVVRQERNCGQFQNVNDGIARATGEFVAVFHADDVYAPTILEREVAFLQAHPDVGAVFCLDQFMTFDGRVYGHARLPPDVAPATPLPFPVVLNAILRRKNRFLRTPSAVVRRRAYETVGPYRPRYGSAADLDMWLRIARHYRLAVLDEHLFRYRHSVVSEAGRYHHLRTEPENFFDVVDDCLREGGMAVAQRSALRDYEAHRSEDRIMIAINQYIRGDRAAARATLQGARPRVILGSAQVARGRLLALLLALRVITRLPHSRCLAAAARARWHGQPAPDPC
jgi:glycosyltransferase involved in cell wall biosynthesis